MKLGDLAIGQVEYQTCYIILFIKIKNLKHPSIIVSDKYLHNSVLHKDNLNLSALSLNDGWRII